MRWDDIFTTASIGMALACCVFAFVGIARSSYWIDELFSLFVVDHDLGLGEVLHRALTDTHPPAYYFILYGWLHLFGHAEAATRSLSALCLIGALAVLFVGTQGAASLRARSFALALAAGSRLFFEQTQNARSYGLAVLLAAVLMVLTLKLLSRMQADERPPWRLLALSCAVGLLGAFTHFYLFLGAGACDLLLLLSARSWRQRMGVVLSGLIVAGAVGAYVVRLLHSSQQDLQNMWFSNAPLFLVRELVGGVGLAWSWTAAIAVALLAAMVLLRKLLGLRSAAAPSPLARLCATTIVLTILGGLVVSLVVAPSFGKRNLIVLGPYLWGLAAWMFDAAQGSGGRRLTAILLAAVVTLTLLNGTALATRALPRNEPWRESAAYVDSARGCGTAPLAVVLPFRFGPSTPFFRQMAERRFFGFYGHPAGAFAAYTPAEFASAGVASLVRARAAQPGCSLLAWGVHDLKPADAEQIRASLARDLDVGDGDVTMRAFASYKVGLLGQAAARPTAFVFELKR